MTRRRRTVVVRRLPAWTPTSPLEAVALLLCIAAALFVALVIL